MRKFIIFLILALSVLIHAPSLTWSYHLDDLDNFYSISSQKNFSDTINYILSPGDGHFIPFLRILYLFCFRNFWLDPFFFHSMTLLALLLSGFLLFKMVERLSRSFAVGIFAAALFLWSTSYLRCLETSFAHFILSLPFVLGVLYAFLRYQETRRWPWILLASVLAFLAPLISAMGVLTGLWLVLFSWLCLPKKENILKKMKLAAFPLLLWLAGVVIFLMKVCPGLSPSDPGLYFQNAVVLTAKSLWIYILPSLGGVASFALLTVLFLTVIGIIDRKEISWRYVCFFLLWIIGNYLYIYFGRGKWGMRLLYSQHYGFYAFVGFVSVFSFFLTQLIKRGLAILEKKRILQFLLVPIVIVYVFFQYSVAVQASQGRKSLLILGQQTTTALKDYGAQRNSEKIFLKDALISYPVLYPYARPVSYFTAFLLPTELQGRIYWAPETEKSFLDFLEKEKTQYPEWYDLFHSGKL
ncbi:MAG: hypothetical protein NT079_06625 [Candidatus Omnitrophica bacterium]|nr:hypothetical protein [Candidatus Omnitrophota bacterium]